MHYTTLLQAPLQAIEALLRHPRADLPAPVRQALVGLVAGGGKRLRPALVLLSAHLCGADLAAAIPVAAATEMLHTATLIHDDLIDGARMRRGVETLNAVWSPAATVLVGDMAFAWAAGLATQSGDLQMIARFTDTLDIICTGELEQLFWGKGTLPTEDAYFARIYAKTASLFELAAEAGAILARRPPAEAERLRAIGRHIGEAFQIVDDVLDFTGDAATLGKPSGSDLRQGLATLPALIYQETHPDDARLAEVLADPTDESRLSALLADLRRSDAIPRALAEARARSDAALALLAAYPATPHRAALAEIAAFAVQREF